MTGFASILELAEACDVPVRWSCRTGVCHTCETGLLDGAVEYSPGTTRGARRRQRARVLLAPRHRSRHRPVICPHAAVPGARRRPAPPIHRQFDEDDAMTDTTLPALACAFPPSHDLPSYARRAEELGYERVWVFDSPALYGDIWIALARVGRGHRTDRPRHRRRHTEPAPRDGDRVGHRVGRRDRAGPPRGRVRHRIHRPQHDGAARNAVDRPRRVRAAAPRTPPR